MKTTMLNSLWLVLVIAAYVAGTMRPAGLTSSAAAGDPGFTSKTARPFPHGGSASAGAAAALHRGGGSDTWLDAFRGRDHRISAANVEEAAAAVLRESDPVTATRRFTQLLAELSLENAPALLQVLQDQGGAGKAPEYLTLLAHAWGQLDGLSAVTALESLRGRGSESAKATALAAWAAADPAAAIAWMESRTSPDTPSPDRRADAVWSRGLLAGLARRDVDEAMAYLLTMSSAEQRGHVGVLVEEKLKDGVVAAGDWALQLPDEPMRTTALETVGMRFLRQDLDGAMQWAESIADRQDAHELVADVADAMATRDPGEAADWVAGLPAGPSQDHAYEDLFENWSDTDPVAAGQSLSRMDPGPARDTAIQAFSRTVLSESPEDAMAWAGAITDTNRRSDLQVDLARRWQKSSPDQAAAWVTANLPDALQARILPAK